MILLVHFYMPEMVYIKITTLCSIVRGESKTNDQFKKT